MKFSKETIEKVQKNEFDINAVKEILDEIIKRDFKGKIKIKYVLNKKYTKQFGYKEDSPNNALAYADPKSRNMTMIVADIPTFVTVFGSGIENTHNISFPRLSLKYNYNANNYFKILHVLFHELAHAKQNYNFYKWYTPLKRYKKEEKKFGQKRIKQLTELSINILSNIFIGTVDDDVYLKNHELLSIEHQAETEGIFQTIKLFEKEFPEQNSELDTINMLLKPLLNEYEIEGNKLISPYDKFIEAQEPFVNKITKKYQRYVRENLSALDNYTLLSYGMPVDKDLFLEVCNINSRNFNSIKDCKKYIKKL